MDYMMLFLVFFAVLFLYKLFTSIVKTLFKIAVTAAFLTLIIFVMSNSVGLV